MKGEARPVPPDPRAPGHTLKGGIEQFEWAPAPYASAALSILAALVHLWMMPEFFERRLWTYGSFFLVAAIAQGLHGMLVLRWPGRPLVLAGIFGNFTIVALYVVTRTAGIPFFGPYAWEVQQISALDLTATAAEVALISVLAMLLEGALRAKIINVLFVLGIVVWVLGLIGILT